MSIIDDIKYRIEPATPPVHIATLLEEFYFDQLGNELAAYEKAEQQLFRVKKSLYKLLEETRTQPWFAFNSTSDDYIQGAYYIEKVDSAAVAAAKQGRLNVEPLKGIIKALTFTEFEMLCPAVLSLIGVRDARRTPHSRDQGIDFHGKLQIADFEEAEFPFMHFQHDLIFWIIGQAKHYPDGKVSAPEIRSLAGAVYLARFKEYASTTRLASDLPLRSCDPVVSLFFTTGSFSRDAIRIAKNSGIILKDIDDIASLLADKMTKGTIPNLTTKDQVLEWLSVVDESGI
jgi:hypothetical protein